MAIELSDKVPIPNGSDLFYECLRCSDVIPSLPRDNIGCTCGNVFVDIDAYRVAIDDYSKIRVLRRTKSKRGGAS
ncbi:MAG TPA: hypothetical protein VMS98_15355 [Thermoanaerobaculia bacterium]|nr:hypothetical protein [Thermoanaerobaculia bacterium]